MGAEGWVYVGVAVQFAGTTVLLIGLDKTAQGFNKRLPGIMRDSLSGLAAQLGQPPAIEEMSASDDAGSFDTATVKKSRAPYRWHQCPWVKLRELGCESNRIQAEVDKYGSALSLEVSARETADHEIRTYMKRQHEGLGEAVASMDAKLWEAATGTITWQTVGLLVSLVGAILTTVAAMHIE